MHAACTFPVQRKEINVVKVRFTMRYSSRKLSNDKVITTACNFWRKIACSFQVMRGNILFLGNKIFEIPPFFQTRPGDLGKKVHACSLRFSALKDKPRDSLTGRFKGKSIYHVEWASVTSRYHGGKNFWMKTIGSFCNADGEQRKNNRFRLANNVARASPFFVHFLAVVARLQHETSYKFHAPTLWSRWVCEKLEKHTSTRRAKLLNHSVSIRKMKCHTFFISSVCNHLLLLFLHFKFRSYHYFNGFCLHILLMSLFSY